MLWTPDTALSVTKMAFQIIILLFMLYPLTNAQDHCDRGEYLHKPDTGSEVCQPCENKKTFMPVDKNKNPACFNCTQVKDPKIEKLISDCNQTHDTVILCKTGFYRKIQGDDIDNGTCVRCDACGNYTGRPCLNYSNTVCCPDESYEVINDRCKKRPFTCGPGQYHSESLGKCIECQDGSFKSKFNHTDSKCEECNKQDDVNHKEMTVQKCNKTHDAIINCKFGYYREAHALRRGDCNNCRNCTHLKQYVGRNCSETQDAICCPKPDMNVTDSGDCTDSEKFIVPSDNVTCGENKRLQNGLNNTNAECLPCQNDTFQDKKNHTESDCRNCTEFKGDKLPETCKDKVNNKNSENHDFIAPFIFISIVVVVVVVVGICLWKKPWRRNKKSGMDGGNSDKSVKELLSPSSTIPTGDNETAL